MSQRLDLMKSRMEGIIARDKESLRVLREKLLAAKEARDEDAIERLERKINDKLFNLDMHNGDYNSYREDNAEDVSERVYLHREFKREVDEAIPDDIPIVFHGNRSLGLIETIMRTGGLFTPEERGADFRSLATQIDVTSKKYIGTSIEFAEPGVGSLLPYGAIFVFMPQEDEYQKVLQTGEGSEVPGGVKSINFRENPERLIAIITSSENVEKLKKIASETGIDADKIVSPQDFLKLCREKYRGMTV